MGFGLLVFEFLSTYSRFENEADRSATSPHLAD